MRSKGRWIEIERDVEGVTIPNGDDVTLTEGDKVLVEQELGDQFTLRTRMGRLVRIGGEDGDAIGREPGEADDADTQVDSDKPVEEQVWDQLKTCYDPEIPIDIVELGLVYECELTERDDGTYDVRVEMTLTAPGCGMGDIIAQDAKQKVEGLAGVNECEVEIVFDPPWTPDKLTDEARLELGMI